MLEKQSECLPLVKLKQIRDLVVDDAEQIVSERRTHKNWNL